MIIVRLTADRKKIDVISFFSQLQPFFFYEEEISVKVSSNLVAHCKRRNSTHMLKNTFMNFTSRLSTIANKLLNSRRNFLDGILPLPPVFSEGDIMIVNEDCDLNDVKKLYIHGRRTKDIPPAFVLKTGDEGVVFYSELDTTAVGFLYEDGRIYVVEISSFSLTRRVTFQREEYVMLNERVVEHYNLIHSTFTSEDPEEPLPVVDLKPGHVGFILSLDTESLVSFVVPCDEKIQGGEENAIVYLPNLLFKRKKNGEKLSSARVKTFWKKFQNDLIDFDERYKTQFEEEF